MQLLQILSIVISAIVLISVLELIRRNSFKERYALLWLLASIVLLIFSFSRKLLHFVAGIIGIYYPPSFLFLLGTGFLILITLHFSIAVSSLSEKNKTLSQELGILKEELKRIKDQQKKENEKKR